MAMEKPKALTPEEIAAFQNSRALADAELVKGGGGHDPEYRGFIAPTQYQNEAARVEMLEDLSAKYEQLKIESKRQADEIEDLKQQLEEMRDKENQEELDNIRTISEEEFEKIYGSKGDFMVNNSPVVGEIPSGELEKMRKGFDMLREIIAKDPSKEAINVSGRIFIVDKK